MNANAPVPATFGQVFEDIMEVLWAPAAVFGRARGRTFGKYLVVLTLIAIVITAVTAGLIQPWIDASFDLQLQMAAKSGRAMPEEAVASMRKFGAVGYYMAPLFVVVFAAFGGGLLLMLSGKLMQASLRFREGVLIAALAAVPRILSMVASAVVALVQNAESARSMYDLSIGPARFLDPLTISPVLLQLVGGIDFFNLWQLVIFGIGASVIANVARSTGFLVGLLAWILGTAVPLLPTLLAG
jgi:hypothetical protein